MHRTHIRLGSTIAAVVALVAGVLGVAVPPAGAVGPDTGWRIESPSGGFDVRVRAGIDDRTVNTGAAGWDPGTAPCRVDDANTGATVLFAHRTAAGGPFRRLHQVRVGDELFCNDVRYRVVSSVVTTAAAAPFEIYFDAFPGRDEVVLVACTRPNRLPSALSHRLIVRAVLDPLPPLPACTGQPWWAPIPDTSRRADQVARLYAAVFQRSPDPAGLAAGVRSRASLSRLAATLLRSGEFRARYGRPSNADFVRLVYRNVLGREPDPQGFATWVNALNRGRISRGGLLVAFSESAEFRTGRAMHPPGCTG